MRFIFILVTGCWLLVTSAFAQGIDIAILKAGVGARPLGMGGAFTAVADNADAPFWNPAGLGEIGQSQITAMQTRIGIDTDHYYISYVQPLLGGTIGLAWIQMGLGSIPLTSGEVDANNEVQNLGITSYFSNAYLLAFGKELNDKISLGLTATYLTSDLFQYSKGTMNGYSITPGIMLRLSNNNLRQLTIGLKVEDLFNQQNWGTGTVEQAPAKIRLGLAYRSPNPGLFAVDVSQTLKRGYAAEAAIGYEWERDGLSLRAGYGGNGISAGAGFVSGHTRLDYAYVTQQDVSKDNVHRVSLTGVW